MFKESQLNLEQKEEETPGQLAEQYVAEFLECHEDLVVTGSVELTEKRGKDDYDGVDAFISLKRAIDDQEGLPIAIDFTAAGEEKRQEKYKRQHIIPFVSQHDESGKVISERIPRFIIDNLDLEKWIHWGEQADQEGLPITDIIEKQGKDLEEKLYKSMLGKMWVQTKKLTKGGIQERERIAPYKALLEKEVEKHFTDKELEVLNKVVA